MGHAEPKEEYYNGVSTLDVPSAAWGWSGQTKRSMLIAGWVSVAFLVAMLWGNHQGNVENIWLIALAAIMAIGLLCYQFAPKGKQVTTVTARNKPLGHVEPQWARDQLEFTGAYAKVNDSEARAWNRIIDESK